MRKMKLLSVLLAVLMIISCVPAALFVGASAEEVAETATVSYKDPRESATKIYYAPTSDVTAAMLSSDPYYATATKLSSNSYIYAALTNGYVGTYANGTGFEPGSVLVIPFSGNQELNFATNTGLKRSEQLAFTAPTLFRTDGTKLPIVIEGIQKDDAVPTLILDVNYTAYASLGFANDYYFCNLTIKKTTTATQTFYAGSGEVVFHNVTFDFNESATVTFAGDSYTVDPFYNWTEDRFNANKGTDGLLPTGFTFGKNTSVHSKTILAAAASDGHSGTTVYKNNYPKVADALTDANVTTAVEKAAAMRHTDGKLLSTANNSVVYPNEVSAYITIDNGKAASDTADFTKVHARKGCTSVAKAEIKLISGNVKYMYGDAYTDTGSYNGQATKDKVLNEDYWANKEIYVGDSTITIDGGKVIDCVYGLYYSYLIGNYTVNLNGGVVKRINGTESVAKHASIKGNYLFHATGGELGEFYGGCEVFGEGNTAKNVVDGGTFKTLFNGQRFAVSSLTNEINGGTFVGIFRGATAAANYAGGDVTNVITGGTFKTDFYTGGTNAASTLGNVTTNISGGSFQWIGKGASVATSNELNVISTKSTDVIKFSGSSLESLRGYTFDKFEMNGGTINFWSTSVTAKNAKGSVVVRNVGEWLPEKTYFTFTPAEGETLDITTTQEASVTSRGTVKVEDGKYLVVAEDTGIAPTGASLILTERIAVKFVFAKDDVDAIGKDNFEAAVLLGSEDLAEGAELVAEGDTYTLTTKGIGIPDSKTQFTLSGNHIKDCGFSIAALTDAAITAWETAEPDWANWAKALKNMIGVAVDGNANAITPADKDYGNRAASRDESVVTAASATLVMSSAVGVKLDVTCSALPANPVVKVNGNKIDGVYTTEDNVATVNLYFAPQYMEQNFTVEILDGETEIFELTASVAGFAKELNTDAGNALLAYVQATTVVASK